MRRFNTSGVNIPSEHYTVPRTDLIQEGIDLVENKKYFTIWAPRQTGKSTYFHLLKKELEQLDYYIATINFENYKNAPLSTFLDRLVGELNKFWKTTFSPTNISDIFYKIEQIKDRKLVLIIDEVEGINNAYFGEFLHSIRNAYHSRTHHALKSVILVGVSNITGIIQDHASPFNIADNLPIKFFTDEETIALLGQHEKETGQLFSAEVKAKIIEITANQPGLVNGFAQKLVADYPDKKLLDYQDYLVVEDWYLTKSIDKNIGNIIKIGLQHRAFVEQLLFSEQPEPFRINNPIIKRLYANGFMQMA